MWLTVTIVFALALALLVPYLIKEIRRGKVEVGPRTPTGAGDVHPGQRGNPAPGQPETAIDPYDAQARR
jgi:hypothetical protein